MSVAAPSALHSAPRHTRRDGLAQLVVGLPDLAAAGVAGFSLPCIVLLLAGDFHRPLALTLGVIGALAGLVAGRPSRREPLTRATVVCALLVLAFVALWLLANFSITSEDVYIHRDAGTYTVTARWLMDHPRLPVTTQPDVFGSPTGYSNGGAGFGYITPTTLFAQGNHLLPALLACAGWTFGTTGILKGTLVLSALALLVLYGLARRIVGPVAALVVPVAMAVSFPMLYVSRDSFSEPLAMLLLLGGMSLTLRAIASGRLADFALAGVVAGLSASARIDSDAGLLALLPAATIMVAVAPQASALVHLRRWLLLLVWAVVGSILGYLDVTRLSSGYYQGQRSQILDLAAAAGALLLVGATVVVGSRSTRLRRIVAEPRTSVVTFRLAAVGLAVAAAVLASRPLWLVSRGPALDIVAIAQRAAGLAADPTRLYSEQTVHWLALYLGWPTVVLGLVGYLLLLHRLLRGHEIALTGPILMGLTLTLLYLVMPSITPDQPWASRRFIPVALPLLLIAATEVLRVLAGRVRRWGRPAAILAGVVVIAVPAASSAPVARLAEERGQLGQLEAICAAVGPHAAIVITDDGALYGYAQALRSFCEVPVLGLHAPTSTTVAAVRASVVAHGRTLFLLTQDRATIPYPTLPDAAYVHVRTRGWPSTINTRPVGPKYETVPIYLATAEVSGLAVEVSR